MMIINLKNPKDLVICLKFLIHLSLTNEASKQNIKNIITRYMGKSFEQNESHSENLLTPLDEKGQIKLTIESFINLKEEEEVTKKGIMMMIEEIIFADEEVLPSERKFYDIAKKYLNVDFHKIQPTVELFEFLNVLNLVSGSDFANMKEFSEIWVKYMGPDINVYYKEAFQNLENLDLEEQIQKIGKDLQKLKNIDEEQKLSIRSMIEEIIFADGEFTDEEKILYDLMLENMEITSNTENFGGKKGFEHIFSNIENNRYFNIFINCMIVFTGILVGIETNDDLVEDYQFLFHMIDQTIKYIFLVEILIRFTAKYKRPLEFFSDGWNIFDSILVIATFLPFGAYPFILRVLRLLRFSRIFRRVPQLRMIIISLIHSIKPIVFVGIILVLLIYIYGVVGKTAFSKNDPVHFGSLGISMVSLVRAATFEDWTDLMYTQMYGCNNYGYESTPEKCTSPSKMPNFSIFFFISFIIISGVVIINFVVGVIIQSMSDSKEKMRRTEELSSTLKNMDLIVKNIRSQKMAKLIEQNEKKDHL
ncbi:MAG: ion transporter [Deltaproteobacteria bacterium]|nr:ion transporter [Deltaproteobacteria bacterium]